MDLRHVNIKKIGKIYNITLNNLKKINYIVGENGSGKSALLAGIAKTNEMNIINRYKNYFYNDSEVCFYNQNGVKTDTVNVEIVGSRSGYSPFWIGGWYTHHFWYI